MTLEKEKIDWKLLKKDISTFIALHTWEMNQMTLKLVRESEKRLSTFANNKINHYPPTKKEIKEYCE